MSDKIDLFGVRTTAEEFDGNVNFDCQFDQPIITPWGARLSAFEVLVGSEGFLMGRLFFVEDTLSVSVSPESLVAPD